MTDQQVAQTPSPYVPQSPQDAKAMAKAEKAYRKASRPWFKKKRFILPIALVVLVALLQMTSGGDDAATTGAGTGAAAADSGSAKKAAKKPAKVAKSAPGVGDSVRDGKFEFVVTDVERAGKTIPAAFGAKETAQGEFVIVHVNVKNIGDEAQTLDTTGQKLINDKGQEFEPSSAIFALEGADKFFLEKINPGNKVTDAPLLFDVAPGTKLTSIELHDSMFSSGVTVTLS
jgi:hypothetical protein